MTMRKAWNLYCVLVGVFLIGLGIWLVLGGSMSGVLLALLGGCAVYAGRARRPAGPGPER